MRTGCHEDDWSFKENLYGRLKILSAKLEVDLHGRPDTRGMSYFKNRAKKITELKDYGEADSRVNEGLIGSIDW